MKTYKISEEELKEFLRCKAKCEYFENADIFDWDGWDKVDELLTENGYTGFDDVVDELIKEYVIKKP